MWVWAEIQILIWGKIIPQTSTSFSGTWLWWVQHFLLFSSWKPNLVAWNRENDLRMSVQAWDVRGFINSSAVWPLECRLGWAVKRVTFRHSRVQRRGLYWSFMRLKGMVFLLPEEGSSGRCHFDFFRGARGWEERGMISQVKWPLSGVSGSSLYLAVGLWWSLTHHCWWDWEEGGMERRVEAISFNVHGLVCLWDASKPEMESDRLSFQGLLSLL